MLNHFSVNITSVFETVRGRFVNGKKFFEQLKYNTVI